MMRRTVVSALTTLLAAASLTLSAYAQQSSTAFTYQGFLKDNGQPANGTYDLKFTLYDAATEGDAIGDPVLIEDLQIQNGLFTVEIDFGVSPFAQGERRWLEIGIRSGDSDYDTLPRIELTPVPYALYAQKAKEVDIPQVITYIANRSEIFQSNAKSYQPIISIDNVVVNEGDLVKITFVGQYTVFSTSDQGQSFARVLLSSNDGSQQCGYATEIGGKLPQTGYPIITACTPPPGTYRVLFEVQPTVSSNENDEYTFSMSAGTLFVEVIRGGLR